MENSISIEIPQEWVQGLEWDQGILLQEIVQLGIRQIKVRRALDLYKSSNVSLGYAAQQVGIPKRELIVEARVRGIEPSFDEQTVREELGQ
jgi:predicted HTH domain antitoxin